MALATDWPNAKWWDWKNSRMAKVSPAAYELSSLCTTKNYTVYELHSYELRAVMKADLKRRFACWSPAWWICFGDSPGPHISTHRQMTLYAFDFDEFFRLAQQSWLKRSLLLVKFTSTIRLLERLEPTTRVHPMESGESLPSCMQSNGVR